MQTYTSSRSVFDSATNRVFYYEAEALSIYRNYTVGWKIRNGKSIEYTKDPKVLDNIDEEDVKNIDSFLGEFNMIGGDKCE